MVAPTPFAYFKDLRIGDILAANDPNVTLQISGPDIKTTVSALRATMASKGGAASYQIELGGIISRSYLTADETARAFVARKGVFLASVLAKAGLYPTGQTSPLGIIAGGLNAQDLFKYNGGSIGAGSNITIALTAPDGGTLPITTTSGELWFIFDTSSGANELFLLNGTGPLSSVEAAALVYTYTSARLFRPTWAFDGVGPDGNITLAGDDEGALDRSEFKITFKGVSDMQYGVTT